ncbi:DUF1844 domain-containing protein [Myxococcota bacterium]|jgi:hypothetical protein|nr:DUF1844 domain-containing protein [Myxococcota bacterium]MBU1244261.1 DUF1844 domain-containing protein [Myxococcota bacterium]MBU1411104.1 DUF1844 domain-containing protein [Myxococcota bacterium]MBU1508775.1 DUF1844 domain-containing protein [Myxococcota bacterium]PKN17830.1 MAG: DUF1844 domain-containing protein [Deltaproteobacteria bacterium HGW-Deltaproteobacteria-22]
MKCNPDLSDAPIDFSSFVISLSSSVLISLGEIPNPDTDETMVDVCFAKQTIQILEMLQEKTRGNLNDGEQELIDSILFDLRFKYVQHVKKTSH